MSVDHNAINTKSVLDIHRYLMKKYDIYDIYWVCKCGLIESVCNTLQKYNHVEFRCDCKELNGWSSCIDDYI